MPIPKLTNERRQRLEGWENAVANMSAFAIPSNYNITTNDKYDRFTGYLKEWVFRTLTTTSSDNYSYKLTRDIDDDMNDLFFADFTFGVTEDKKNEWWKNAMDVGRGKKNVANNLARIKSSTGTDKEAAFGMFMPTYRAIKESFEKRSVFQWIFNHSQYVAERDALRALTGIITTLTGSTVADLDARLALDKKNIPTSNKEQLEEHLKNVQVIQNEKNTKKESERENVELDEFDELDEIMSGFLARGNKSYEQEKNSAKAVDENNRGINVKK
jgi:hypothetical protein